LRVALGGALGLMMGLALGALAAGVFVISDAPTGAAVGSLVGAFLGGTLGAFWYAYRTVGTDADAWQATFHESGAGPFGVTVGCRNDDVDRAASVPSKARGEGIR
jgi:hypothetical protein